jgi:murein DD-endopeptidase MepM/ murein hydrolase activator NlpD
MQPKHKLIQENSMSENTAKNTSTNNFSSITPNLSVQDFLNYKPNRGKAQDFDSPRSNRPLHEGIDYGSKAGITLGTKITAVEGGIATPIYNYYTNSGTGITDAGVMVTGKDSKGRTVQITYGHLDLKSVQQLFNGKSSIMVNAGDTVGNVGTTGKIKDGKGANNEYHVHVKVQIKGQKSKLNPLEHFKEEYKAQTSIHSTVQTLDGNNIVGQLGNEYSIQQENSNPSLAAKRYEAISNILKGSGLQEDSPDWSKAVIQTALGTDLGIEDVKGIAKHIPGIEPENAEKLVTVAVKNSQEVLM